MNKRYLYVALAVILSGVVVFIGLSGQTFAPGNKVPSPGSKAPSETRGQVACLPHKGNGPHTLECAYGIKDSSGKYYAVKDDSQEIIKYNMTDEVIVSGTVSSPEPSYTYDVVGIISASAIRKVQ